MSNCSSFLRMFSIFRIRNLWMHLRLGTPKPKWEGKGRFAIMLQKLRFFIFLTFFLSVECFLQDGFPKWVKCAALVQISLSSNWGSLMGHPFRQKKEWFQCDWCLFAFWCSSSFRNDLNVIWDMLPFTVAAVFGSITLFKLSLWTFDHLNSPISMYMIIYTIIQLAIYCSMPVLKQKASIYYQRVE